MVRRKLWYMVARSSLISSRPLICSEILRQCAIRKSLRASDSGVSLKSCGEGMEHTEPIQRYSRTIFSSSAWTTGQSPSRFSLTSPTSHAHHRTRTSSHHVAASVVLYFPKEKVSKPHLKKTMLESN